MKASELTVTVHLDVELDGKPITSVLAAPASMEPLGETREGLHIHLNLDGRQLAKVLLPHITSLIRTSAGRKSLPPRPKEKQS